VKETDLMHVIQAELCRDPMVRLFRNNVGNGWAGDDPRYYVDEMGARRVSLRNYRRIQFGLGPGTADLIGGKSVLVTPEMVGRRVFIFASPEVKGEHGRPTEQQKTFLHVIRSLGGLADVVRSVEDAREVMEWRP
jgi:hypothetical protein